MKITPLIAALLAGGMLPRAHWRPPPAPPRYMDLKRQKTPERLAAAQDKRQRKLDKRKSQCKS